MHEARAERVLGFVLIVRATQEPEIVERCPAAFRDGLDVIDLERCSRAADAAVLRDERALALIALPDFALEGGWDRAALWSFALHSRLLGDGKLLFLELRHERSQGTPEHLAHAVVAVLRAEQVLRTHQVRVHGIVHGELGLVALWCCRGNAGIGYNWRSRHERRRWCAL
jgi:hypothetical protein